MGPRQTIGVSCSMRKPTLIAWTPWPSMGSIVLPSREEGRPVMPSIVGWEGP